MEEQCGKFEGKEGTKWWKIKRTVEITKGTEPNVYILLMFFSITNILLKENKFD